MSKGSPYLDYENKEIRLVSTRNIPRVETPGLILEEIKEGEEFSTFFWIAQILVDLGIARYLEDSLSQSDWTQIHFKERLNPAGPPSSLIDDFYSKAYISFKQIKSSDQISSQQLLRIKARYREVLESRISRIARIATSESTTPQKALEIEETKLYEEVHRLVSSWRKKMRNIGE